MRAIRIMVFAIFCMAIAVPQEKTVILENGDVIHGLVKETESTVRIKTKHMGVVEVQKSAVKKINDTESNAALADERDITAGGMGVSTPGENKIAINDFKVSSDNPEHKYIGKGFSELIAFEVKKSPRVRLVEREKRSELFKEMELSLTGAVDEKDSVKAGKILACDFIVFGDIVSMPGSLIVSLRMTKVETGEVVWRKQITEPGKNYPYISAFFAKDILTTLKLGVDRSINDALASKTAMNEDAVVKLSKGIDAYDNKDMSKAKAELYAAKQLDPNNKVVQAFLNKLSGATSKFKVVPERYTTMVNPAYLGAAKQDRIYASLSIQNFPIMIVPDNAFMAWVQQPSGPLTGNGYGALEMGGQGIIGYSIPVTKGWGLTLEYNFSGFSDPITGGLIPKNPGNPNFMNYSTFQNNGGSYHRGMLASGFSLGECVGFGAGIAIAYREIGIYDSSPNWTNGTHVFMAKGSAIGKDRKDPAQANYDFDQKIVWGAEFGILIKDPSDSVMFDTLVSYYMDNAWYYDTTVSNFISYRTPIFIENTITFALNEKRTFIVGKQMNEIYYDHGMYMGKLMPAIEHWLFDWLSVRAGIEGTMIIFSGKPPVYGLGGLAGITPRIKLGNANLDIDINYTYRQRPSRAVKDLVVNEHLAFVTFSLSGLFVNRD
ncbi:MAG: hypothetical protein AABZ39_00705 [Spirochaetota bacterium]